MVTRTRCRFFPSLLLLSLLASPVLWPAGAAPAAGPCEGRNLEELISTALPESVDQEFETVIEEVLVPDRERYLKDQGLTEEEAEGRPYIPPRDEKIYWRKETRLTNVPVENEALLGKVLGERIEAIRCLGESGADDAFDALVKIYAAPDEEEDALLSETAKAIGAIGGEDSLDLLVSDLRSEEERFRLYALEGLAFIPGEEAAARIISLLWDDAHLVRAGVDRILATRPYPEVRETAAALIESHDCAAQVRGLNILEGQCAADRGAELLRDDALQEILSALATDSSCRDEAGKAAKLLARLGSAGPGETVQLTEADEELLAIVEDDEYDFCRRVHAAEALLAKGWQGDCKHALAEQDLNFIADQYFLFILLGLEESIPLLVELLIDDDSGAVYNIFLSSEEDSLVEAAREWHREMKEYDESWSPSAMNDCFVTWGVFAAGE